MASTSTPARRSIQFRLLPKLLSALLLSGLLPLLVLSATALQGTQTASETATRAAVDALDNQTLATLQIQAAAAAGRVSQILDGAAQATVDATLLPHTPAAYQAFVQAHQSVLWYPDAGAAGGARQVAVPLYSELAYIDARGREIIRVADGQIVPDAQLRDVSVPANTSYATETYFTATRSLPGGGLYIGPYTAWHLSSPPDSASPAAQGAVFGTYRAVIRFGTPLYTPAGAFDGILLLTLDARHLMEQIIHIIPGTASERTVWPDYATGNYAYMWDSAGWLIAHPVFARIRGLDPAGQEIPTFMNATPKAQRSLYPFNMHSDANPDAPRMYAATQAGQIGYQSNLSQGGVLKANVYAPIACHYGPYATTGIFGGLVIGANLEQFHAPANTVRASIQAQQDRLQIGTLGLAALVVLLLGAFSLWLARSITRPIAHLTQAARAIEEGELDTVHLHQVINRRFGDEVSKLAEVFQTMAQQIQLREQHLKEQIVEMRIQIDEQKMAQQVRELTDTDYFRNLQNNARSMRARTHRLRDEPTSAPAGSTEGSDP